MALWTSDSVTRSWVLQRSLRLSGSHFSGSGGGGRNIGLEKCVTRNNTFPLEVTCALNNSQTLPGPWHVWYPDCVRRGCPIHVFKDIFPVLPSVFAYCTPLLIGETPAYFLCCVAGEVASE